MNNHLVAFGIPQGPELWIIILLVFLLFGAKRLPQLARSLGRSMGEFRNAKSEFETEIKRAADDQDRNTAERLVEKAPNTKSTEV